MNMNIGICKGCNKQILWVRTPAGKNMPCNPTVIYYKEDPESKVSIVTPEGAVVKGILNVPLEESTGIGYTPHWQNCTYKTNPKK